MNPYKSLAVGFSLLAFGGGYAVAQQTQSPTQPPAQQQAQQPQAKQDKKAERLSPDQLRVSKLKGKDVYDKSGNEIGEIEDLVVDMQSHQVHAAIVKTGGVVGSKKYAFPLSDFTLGEKGRLVLDVDKQRMKNSEGFAKGQWPELGNEYWGRTKGQVAAAQSGTSTHAAQSDTNAAQASAGGTLGAGGQGGTSAASSSTQQNLMRTSDVIGKDVQDRAGEDVGQVDDVIVSLNDGSIKGFRLDVDKAGETTVEPTMLTAGLDKKLVVGMNAEELRSRSQDQEQSRPGRNRSTSPATDSSR